MEHQCGVKWKKGMGDFSAGGNIFGVKGGPYYPDKGEIYPHPDPPKA